MAFKSSELYYWDGSKWVLAVTNSGSNALADVRLLERLGNPMKMGATVTNFPLDWQSTNASERQGPLTNVFTDYQQVIIREGETHQIIFSGRIYKKEATYDPSVGGNIIRLEAFDSLAELRDFSSAGLDEDDWKKFDLNGVTRSSAIESLINDSLGSGANYLAASGANINNTDKGTGSGSRFRFENSVDTGDAGEYIEPARTGVTSILKEIAGLAANDQHTTNEAEKDRGYTYYVDPNFTVPKPSQYSGSANWTHNPPTMLNYFKRGVRPTLTPATYGLTTKFGAGVSNRTGTPGVLSYPPLDENNDYTTLNATKLITANYHFEKPSQDLYSHAIVTYSGKGETEKADLKVTQHMELLYVSEMVMFTHNNQAGGNAFYKGKDLYDHTNRPNDRKAPPGKLQWNSGTDASPTWVDTNAYVHMATSHSSSAVTGSSTSADYEGIVVGVRIEDESAFDYQLGNMQVHSTLASEIRLRVLLWNGSAFAAPTSENTIDSFSTTPTCKFNSTTLSVGKGRTRNAFGINRPKRVNITDTTSVNSVRKEILGLLHRTNMDLRKGQINLIGPPYYAQDFSVRSKSGNVITLDNINKDESNALNVNTFGIKVGMVVMMFGTDQQFGDDNEAAYGHITAIASDNVSCTLSTVGSYSVDDYIRVFIPIRVGEMLRMDCAQDAILGNHFITDMDYVESRGTVNTTLKTVGHNEDIAFVSGFGIPPSDIDQKISSFTSGSAFGWDSSSVPYGQRPFDLEGITFTRTDRNTLSWTSGFLKIGGEYYSINEGNTGDLSTSIPDNRTQCQPYYIYWDLDVSSSVLQVAPTLSPITVSGSPSSIGTEYVQDTDNIIIAVARAANSGARNVEYEIYGREKNSLLSLDIYKDDPSAFIEDGAMTSALQRKGMQPFSSNITFTPATGGTTHHPTGHHSITVGHDASETNAKTISFADGKTATCSTDTINISAGESYSSDKIWYIYFELTGLTPDSSGNYSNVPINATTNYSVPNTNDRGLLAMAAVSTTWHASNTAIVGQECAIQTFGSKIGNINADNIAANSVTANAIQANSIATSHISGRLAGSAITVDASVSFGSGYNPSTDNFGAGTKAKTFVADGPTPPTSVSIGDLWVDSNDNSKLYRANAVDVNSIVTTGNGWYLFDLGLARATADTGVDNAALAQSKANDAFADAADAQGDATNAKNQLTDIATDTIVEKSEKRTAKVLWDAIYGEYGTSYGSASTTIGITGQAYISLGSHSFRTAYIDAYEALDDYLDDTLDVFNDMGANTTIVRATWLANWKNYYDAKQVLLNKIADQAREAASTADGKAVNADNKAETKKTIFTDSVANDDTGQNGPVAIALQDMWINTHASSQKIFQCASLDGTKRVIGTNWVLRDDAGAINNATTNISGGRILTQAIVLKSGGGQNFGGSTNTDSVLSTDTISASNDAARASSVLLSNTGLYGYNSSGISQFYLLAGDGKAYFGGGSVVADARGLNIVENGSSGASWVGIGFYDGGNEWNTNSIMSISPGTRGTIHGQAAGRVGIDSYLSYKIWDWNGTEHERFGPVNRLSNNTTWFNFPVNTASVNQVLGISDGSGTMADPYETTWRNPPHENISGAGSINTSNDTFLQDITIDSNGHVTAVSAASITFTPHTHSSSYSFGANMITMSSIQDNGNNLVMLYTGFELAYNSYVMGSASDYWDEIYADEYYNVSDQREKSNIANLTNANALAFIKTLQPRSFTRNDAPDITHYGLVAQEVETALESLSIDKTKFGLIRIPPTETVTKTDENGTEYEAISSRVLNYNELIAPLIGAIKELEARIATLEAG